MVEALELVVLAVFYLVPIAIVAGVYLLLMSRRRGSKRR